VQRDHGGDGDDDDDDDGDGDDDDDDEDDDKEAKAGTGGLAARDAAATRMPPCEACPSWACRGAAAEARRGPRRA